MAETWKAVGVSILKLRDQPVSNSHQSYLDEDKGKMMVLPKWIPVVAFSSTEYTALRVLGRSLYFSIGRPGKVCEATKFKPEMDVSSSAPMIPDWESSFRIGQALQTAA